MLKEQNWEELGVMQAEVFEKFLDIKFGDKRSAKIQKALLDAISQFVIGLTKRFNKD